MTRFQTEKYIIILAFFGWEYNKDKRHDLNGEWEMVVMAEMVIFYYMGLYISIYAHCFINFTANGLMFILNLT